MNDLWPMIAAERNEFADFLAPLTADQWNTQSLCTAWNVRDVVGHVIFVATVRPGAFFGTLARSGLNFNRAMNREARRRGSSPPAALVEQLRRYAESRSRPPGDSPVHMLGDTLVHHQDCRRPLGMPRDAPLERIHIVLDALKEANPTPVLGAILGHKRRMAGVRLVATDLDWSSGDGPEVRGPAEALLMTLLGRRAALDDLGGDGLAIYSSKFGLTAEP